MINRKSGQVEAVEAMVITKEPCLKIFKSNRDWGNKTDLYQCGLNKGHEGFCAWRGDLPGGLL